MLRSSVLLFAGAAMLAATVAWGHEIKVMSSRLVLDKAGEKTTVYLSWGHRLPVDELVDADGLERYEILAPEGKTIALKKSGLSMQGNAVELPTVGVYQMLVTRKPSIHTFVFDADGKLVFKRGPKSAVKEGKIDSGIRSSQCARALVVVGPLTKDPVKPAGLPLEIVPLEGPAEWKANANLHFQVLLDGKPLPRAELTGSYVGYRPDHAWCYSIAADDKGVAVVRPLQGGTWVLKVVSKTPAPESARQQYDFESQTTTLTLEIQP